MSLGDHPPDAIRFHRGETPDDEKRRLHIVPLQNVEDPVGETRLGTVIERQSDRPAPPVMDFLPSKKFRATEIPGRKEEHHRSYQQRTHVLQPISPH